ncbi:hypothetical protein Leryth_015039 [Lithospermum erythrorhizon]|nr:hypothetical protein Leryth_015039 [Lithospermum erythrorhizon]
MNLKDINMSMEMEEKNFSSPVSVSLSDQESSRSESVTELAIFIERLNHILVEIMENKKLMETPSVKKAIDSLETDIHCAREFMKRNPRIALLSPSKTVENVIENLGRSLGLVLFACRDLPVNKRENIEALRKEMMNIKYSLSSGVESEFISDIDTEEEEEEIIEEIVNVVEEIVEVEEDETTWDLEDVVVRLRNGHDDELKLALSRFNELINYGSITLEMIDEENVVQVLFDRLSRKAAPQNRVAIIRILRFISSMNDENAENMGESRYLSVLVKSMMREAEEQREAVGLLSKLSDFPSVISRIGRIQGSIVMLVSILNGDNQENAATNAGKILKALSSNTQHALNMAEAGYFKPLVHYLKEGSDMSKILMATAICRMELTDHCRISLGKDEVIEPLVKMFDKGNFEAKLSALNALQSLSCSAENIPYMIESGIVVALLQLLFSVTSVLMTLREPASTILANIARFGSILVKHNVAQQMLSLLNVSTPAIQCNLLDALNSIVSHPRASKVKRKMKACGALQLLFPFLAETKNIRIRTGALGLMYTLSKDMQEELTEHLNEENINRIVSMISLEPLESEKKVAASAIGILGNLPLYHKKLTDVLVNAKILPVLVSILNSTYVSSATHSTVDLAERTTGLMIRFTVSSDVKLQLLSAEQGVIPVLVKLLTSGSSITTKCNAATCLAQLSQNSYSLGKSRKPKWFCAFPSTDAYCKIHHTYCSVKSTLCLIKAGAISPLVQILQSKDREGDEAILSCLATLLDDNCWEDGSNYLAEMSGVEAIIKVIAKTNSKSQEKSLSMLQKILRIDAHRVKYGESVQGVLIDLTQYGEQKVKSEAARLLAHLEVLQEQSSYF